MEFYIIFASWHLFVDAKCLLNRCVMRPKKKKVIELRMFLIFLFLKRSQSFFHFIAFPSLSCFGGCCLASLEGSLGFCNKKLRRRREGREILRQGLRRNYSENLWRRFEKVSVVHEQNGCDRKAISEHVLVCQEIPLTCSEMEIEEKRYAGQNLKLLCGCLIVHRP